MNLRTLISAIGEVDEKLIKEADGMKSSRKKKIFIALGSAAAVLAVVIALAALLPHGAGTPSDKFDGAETLAAAKYPDRVVYNEKNFDDWRAQKRQLALGEEDVLAVRAGIAKSVAAYLSGREGENAVCSPLSIYMGLSMLTETTGGNTRAQLLELLGEESLESLRGRANRAWNALYVNDGVSMLELASSVWLNDTMSYSQEVLDTLAQSYYASAFSGQMGSDSYNKVLRDWLNAHTGGMLTDEIGGVQFDSDTAVALATTVYYRARWYFDKRLTEPGKFHSPGGDTDVQYMHQSSKDDLYLWGDSYGAIMRPFENGYMAVLLPDEGVKAEDLLSDPQAIEVLTGAPEARERSGSYDIDITLPRFDVRDDISLMDALRDLGVTDIMDVSTADFSPLAATRSDGTPGQLFLSKALHGARVKVDEEGCEGAAYTVFTNSDGSAAPPEDMEKIIFTVDRPFLFAVIQSDLPIFIGVVNYPGEG